MPCFWCTVISLCVCWLYPCMEFKKENKQQRRTIIFKLTGRTIRFWYRIRDTEIFIVIQLDCGSSYMSITCRERALSLKHSSSWPNYTRRISPYSVLKSVSGQYTLVDTVLKTPIIAHPDGQQPYPNFPICICNSALDLTKALLLGILCMAEINTGQLRPKDDK